MPMRGGHAAASSAGTPPPMPPPYEVLMKCVSPPTHVHVHVRAPSNRSTFRTRTHACERMTGAWTGTAQRYKAKIKGCRLPCTLTELTSTTA